MQLLHAHISGGVCVYLIIQRVLPRAKGKAFTFSQPFLALPQGEQDRFHFFLFSFYHTLVMASAGYANLDQ